MKNNVQVPKSICKIAHSVYFAYCAYICTSHFADGLAPPASLTVRLTRTGRRRPMVGWTRAEPGLQGSGWAASRRAAAQSGSLAGCQAARLRLSCPSQPGSVDQAQGLVRRVDSPADDRDRDS
jgi:hypothetical protein